MLLDLTKIKPGDIVELFAAIGDKEYSSVRLIHSLENLKCYEYLVPQEGNVGISRNYTVVKAAPMIVLEAVTPETELVWYFKLLNGSAFGWTSMLNPFYVPHFKDELYYEYGLRKKI